MNAETYRLREAYRRSFSASQDAMAKGQATEMEAAVNVLIGATAYQTALLENIVELLQAQAKSQE